MIASTEYRAVASPTDMRDAQLGVGGDANVVKGRPTGMVPPYVAGLKPVTTIDTPEDDCVHTPDQEHAINAAFTKVPSRLWQGKRWSREKEL
ncbi:hypothetical protein NM688_g9103 [Phlebia brevispora]|uniref:Uncharacterized protein n=1 Tax=Phlebia brevispora TaxID=194682 RepID=A0ACC1RNP2_9APHY|nr:hypothetical protein NM688_g9103 [Phlebia brevispora]